MPSSIQQQLLPVYDHETITHLSNRQGNAAAHQAYVWDDAQYRQREMLAEKLDQMRSIYKTKDWCNALALAASLFTIMSTITGIHPQYATITSAFNSASQAFTTMDRATASHLEGVLANLKSSMDWIQSYLHEMGSCDHTLTQIFMEMYKAIEETEKMLSSNKTRIFS